VAPFEWVRGCDGQHSPPYQPWTTRFATKPSRPCQPCSSIISRTPHLCLRISASWIRLNVRVSPTYLGWSLKCQPNRSGMPRKGLSCLRPSQQFLRHYQASRARHMADPDDPWKANGVPQTPFGCHRGKVPGGFVNFASVRNRACIHDVRCVVRYARRSQPVHTTGGVPSFKMGSN
jgi:hypothetical protein